MSQDEAIMERLKASLWFSIGKIVDEETARLKTTATPQFIGAMTEMVWAQIAQDLESFSRHAGRTTVTTDDVMLITRRNEALGEMLRDFVDREKVERETERGAKKGKGSAKGRGK